MHRIPLVLLLLATAVHAEPEKLAFRITHDKGSTVDDAGIAAMLVARARAFGVTEVTTRAIGPGSLEVHVTLPPGTAFATVEGVLSARHPLSFHEVLARGWQADYFCPKDDTFVVKELPRSDRAGTIGYYLLKKEPFITNQDMEETTISQPGMAAPALLFKLTKQGSVRMSTETTRLWGRQMAILLAGRLLMAPQIQEPMGETGMISGNFTIPELERFRALFTLPPLPAELEYLRENR